MTVHPHIAHAARSRLAAIGAALLVTALALSIRIAADAAPIGGEAGVAHEAQEIPGLGHLMRAVNAIGEHQWQALLAGMAIVGVVLAVRRASRHEWLLAIGVLALTSLFLQLDTVLKDAIGSPRPTAADGIAIREQAAGFGFPSGHTYGDVLVFGAFAYLAVLAVPRPFAWLLRSAAVVLIVLAGPARVIAGAHWPSDVIGGYLWGFGILALIIVVASTVARWPMPAREALPATGR